MSLKYHAPTNAFIISSDTLQNVAFHIRGAMKGIREVANLPMDRYEHSGTLTPADHAQQRLITLARDLGIDLGAEWANEIDLRDTTK